MRKVTKYENISILKYDKWKCSQFMRILRIFQKCHFTIKCYIEVIEVGLTKMSNAAILVGQSPPIQRNNTLIITEFRLLIISNVFKRISKYYSIAMTRLPTAEYAAPPLLFCFN